MKHVKGLLRSLVPLIAVAALLGCDARLPRPGEPTIPQKSFVGVGGSVASEITRATDHIGLLPGCG